MSLASIIAANRFGLGARPRELKEIGSDPRGWLLGQVTGSRPAPTELHGLPSSALVFQAFADALQQRRARKQAAANNDSSADKPKMEGEGEPAKPVDDARKLVGGMYREQVAARYRLAVRTEEPFRERLVHFWTNHFAVSADKAQVVGLAAALEYEAIRPLLAGRFVDLLLAVESHPAMILYLDNQASIGPNSPVARRAQARIERKLDINENLAREILELHTLGVNGGYTQTDVTTFALALTGWSVANKRSKEPQLAGKFHFREVAHEPGAKTILGKRYSQEGVEQSRAVLKDIAVHPATAKHVATKLARHFIADEPPASAVERLAKVFRDTEGDLPSLHRALVETPEAWQTPATKFKTPHEFVVSTLRMLDFVPEQPKQILAPFLLLGQRPYSPGSPAGWPDTASEWDGPDALLKRIEWASSIGNRMGSNAQPIELGNHALGAALSERTRTAISRAESGAQGLALLLASPEFQRR